MTGFPVTAILPWNPQGSQPFSLEKKLMVFWMDGWRDGWMI